MSFTRHRVTQNRKAYAKDPCWICPAFWSDISKGDLYAAIVLGVWHPFLNESRWKCLSLVLCHLLLPLPSVVLRSIPYFILDIKQPSFLHTPWSLLNSSMWESLACFKLIQHSFPNYLCWWHTLSHQLSRVTTQRRLVWKCIRFPVQYFGSSTAPHSSSAMLTHGGREPNSHILSEIVLNAHRLTDDGSASVPKSKEHCCCCCLGTQLCPTLWPHGLQPTRLPSLSMRFSSMEWVAMPSSRVSSQPTDWTCISWIGRRILYLRATMEAQRTLISATMLTKMNAAFKKKKNWALISQMDTTPDLPFITNVTFEPAPNFSEPHFPSCKVGRIPPSSPGGKD